MCGITGFLKLSKTLSNDKLISIVSSMADALTHRGPDDCGIWADQRAGITLAHRRLSIIDISNFGHQPMNSGSGRYVIVFNGEIYNFQDIRKVLENKAYRFKGHSDTEVMLAAIEEWGVVAAVKQFVGMFSFALWDKKDAILYLARDRLGIKPLYYGWASNTFLFGSELKSIRQYPEFNAEIDRDSLALYFRYNNIPAPRSIYKGIYKLRQGTILCLDSKLNSKKISYVSFWNAKEVVETAKEKSFNFSSNEAVNQLDILLKEAVKSRMISDVPLGTFLSGGIDSSVVAALMQAQSAKPVKTFTIGFEEGAFNEAKYARGVAEYLGTEHIELYVSPNQALEVIPDLSNIYDEPFADSSGIPTYLVSKLTRQYVKVSLSGDGGDELFAGYNRYFWVKRIWPKISIMPLGLRKAICRGLDIFSSSAWDKIFPGQAGHKVQKLSQVLSAKSYSDVYSRLVSHWQNPCQLVRNSKEPLLNINDSKNMPRGLNFIEKMMFMDLVSYLPDDILTKVDRASMKVGLEARVPLLDHRVVEFSWRLPFSMKIRDNKGKWILRQVLYKYLPEKLFNRPKMGFAVPVDLWLRGPLREWAESLLDCKKIEQDGFLNSQLIKEKWHLHLKGKLNCKDYLWPVLMFQAWKQRWIKK